MDQNIDIFLALCGVSKKRMKIITNQTSLLQDLGIVGDNAWDAFEYLEKGMLVDLGDFRFSEYFPSEIHFYAFIMGFWPRSFLGRKIGRRYKMVTIAHIKQVVSSRKWYEVQNQSL